MKQLTRNIVLSSLILSSATLAYAGRDGGGGDGRKRSVSTEYDIRQAIKAQEFFQPQVYANLKRLAVQKNQLQDVQWPKFIKELMKFPKDEQLVSQVNYKIQNEPCISEGKPSDSSAILPNTVCMSISRLLARQYAPEEVLSAVTALSTHEVAHLMGFSSDYHPQINELQEKVYELVAKVTTDQMINAYINLGHNDDVELAWENIKNNKNNIVALCSSIATASVALEKAAGQLDKIAKVLQSPNVIDQLTADRFIEASFRLMIAQINGCGVLSNEPLNMAFKNLFLNKQQVSMYDVFFAENQSYDKTTENEFVEMTCTMPNYCDELKQNKVNKIPRNNAAALHAELLLIESAYRKYHDTVKPISDKAHNIYYK